MTAPASRRRLLGASLAVLAMGRAASAAARPLLPAVTRIRLGDDMSRTRVVLESDMPLQEVSAEVVDGLVLDLSFGAVAKVEMTGAGRGLVSQWDFDSDPKGFRDRPRLRLALSGPAEIKARFSLPPTEGAPGYRYVIDLVASRKSPRPLIVIDAGHGGHDTGALGFSHREKDLTLAAALVLAAGLRQSGAYRVVLTREDDTFVALSDRLVIAQAAQPDLFLSLHADSSPNCNVCGASAYTLSDSGTARAARGVSRRASFLRTAAPRQDDNDVDAMLVDLGQRFARNCSARFAAGLLDRLGAVGPLVARSHREAGFMVLLSPQIPSVLLEMGFMTNRLDEDRLADPRRIAQMATAARLAVDDYFAAPRDFASRDVAIVRSR
ncbi:N-acetylmuramoyl-L-alanine amidase family protein [Caulobacter soli]|uniref:N-acetylmuramoyl-L-alanine amidase family protein n=1 Tax=Caulobacter soli TaxID=2708539 RepID=UPI0013ED400D|nr:N-acetylmuramoyl-L-alanine amidase [Caulobacter soli]